MRIRSDYPRQVRELENVWIPLPDGGRLAAKIWLPEGSEAEPVPAILEYIPYRKNDWTWRRDSTMHPYFAGQGYACVRVDLRGAGESDGVLLDEYLEQELDDGAEAVAWIAAQPWCTGAVGMFGISWGGFNGLQIAARRPPALKTVITLCSTDDRYADDVHYMGGCLLGVDMLPWASLMYVWNGTPPDPEIVGDGWREMWLNRLAETPPYVEAWLTHQRRDAYWQHGSVCEDFSAIECPVYAIGGWVDGYSNAIPRLLEGLPGTSKGLIGPWGHGFPHDALPGPQIGFLQECLRWWDRWLKGEENGIEHEPALCVWMQDAAQPDAQPEERPGRWVTEPSWPPAGYEPAGWCSETALSTMAPPRKRGSTFWERRPAVSMPVSGAPTATRSTSRRINDPRTGFHSRSTRLQSSSRSKFSASRRQCSLFPSTALTPSSRSGSATSRRTASRRSSRGAF